ncbi:MAG TPA: hypothetical protein PKE45_01260, partial [Caldilineaceae bacterium]|nr:hypothetical protein [Caldilineaceae bacterium]
MNGAEPAVDLNNPLPPGEQQIYYSTGQTSHAGVKWEVTELARDWLPIYGSPFTSNNGLLLRLKNEFCDPNGIRFLPETLFCGGLEFDMAVDAWAEHPDLGNTQVNGTPDDPGLLPSQSGGVRLVVFYHNGATLNEAAPDGTNVVRFNVANGNQLPQGLDKNPPYYYADHLYSVAQPPA